LLLATASLLALLLSALGVYSVISYIVQGRRNEIGIRLARGARKSEVQRVIVTQSVLMAMVGVSVGLAAADPLTLGAVSVMLVLIAAGAGLAPSLRATKVDPVEALRAE
jgi:putative ABC transport system permease protein